MKSSKPVNKHSENAHTYGFVQKDATLEELLKDLVSGHSIIPAKYKDNANGHRKNTNFESANLIMLDIDNGPSIKEAKEIFKYQAISILPTKSHQKPKNGVVADRFRVICPLPVTVNSTLHEVLLSACVKVYNHDDRCIDKARAYCTLRNGVCETLNLSNVFDIKSCLRMYLNGESNRTEVGRIIRKYKDYLTFHDFIKDLKQNDLIDNDFQDISLKQFFCQKLAVSNNYIIETDKKSTFSIDQSESSKPSRKSKNKSDRVRIRNYDWDLLEKNCELYRDFNGSSHSELYYMITNLIHVKGGSKKLREKVKNRPFDQKQRGVNYYNKLINQVKDYIPTSCEKSCSKFETCGNKGNLITLWLDQVKKIKPVNDNAVIVSLEEGRRKLAEVWKEIEADKSDTVHLVIAPTGLGKSSYLERIKEADGTTLIAGPRHDQLESLRVGVPYPILNTAKYPEIERRINQGYRLKALRNNQNVFEDKKSKTHIEEYFDRIKKVSNEKIIKLTHEKLVRNYIFEDLKEIKTIYIDEDISESLFKINSIDIASLEKFVGICDEYNAEGSEYIKQYLNQFINLGDGELKYVGGFDFRFLTEVSEYLIKYNTRKTRKIESNGNFKFEDTEPLVAQSIFDIFYSEHIYRTDKTIHYIQRRELPKIKTVILTATPHVPSYEEYFGNRLKVHNIGNIKPKGKYILFPQYSFSKTSLTKETKLSNEENANKVERIKELNNLLVKNDFSIISHLSISSEINLSAHFYANAGIRHLEGRRLAVIGTPNPPESYVILKAAVLGFDTNYIKRYSDNLYDEVEYNGFKFRRKLLSTDKRIIDIQMHYTSSHLTQSVGRARGINSDVPVLIFSNFPIRFSEIKDTYGKKDFLELVEETLNKEGLAIDLDERIA
ncbi:hypothetical protein HGB47_16515 [Leptospira yasudae]|uniref:hypothetical protein n=1 Tax=Leptospira yasudae TaxID=2202201 RepID=UPI001C4E6F8B|nr:hypothetical protein [Leptospira yasudae]MBW0435217.1 hypothetical protein [Leptospira yasudae]